MNVRIITDIDEDSSYELRYQIPFEIALKYYNKTWKKHTKMLFFCSHCFLLFDKKIKIINLLQYSSWFYYLKKYSKEKVINIFLNHGWGTKKTPGNFFSRKDKAYVEILRKYVDYIICYSEFDQTYFLRHELLDHLPLPKFIPLGHPRNDFLVRNSDNKFLINNEKAKLGIPENCKVILFAPTYRESPKSDYDKKLLELYLCELERIDQQLFAHNINILFRPHYYFRSFPKFNFKNVFLVTADRFPNPAKLMLISDFLVTDYSSIYVDYLLLQKPIIFYQPDLDYYQEIRGLVVDLNDPVQMPGPKISRLSDILDLDENEFKKYDLKASRAFFHKYFDDKATKRLADFLLKLIHDEE